MYNYPSRSEERQERFFYRAEHKLFTSEEVLYPGEAKSLQRQGFKIIRTGNFDTARNLGVYEVSWIAPYGISVPHIVYSYINGVISTYPTKSINNFAKELYVIACKASRSK